MGPRTSPWRARLVAALIDRSPNWSAMWASRAMGRAARVRLPRPVSRIAVSAYARYFDVELGDVDPELLAQGFGSFDEFFTRRLRAGARCVTESSATIVAPCDGYLREIVPVERGGRVIAKGHEYAVGELIVDDELATRLIGGVQATIYLHPRDYHRVHAPCAGYLRSVTAVPGRLLPVTDASVERSPLLFSLNERLVHVIDTDHTGPIVVVMVAAFGVGHMSCAYAEIEAHPSRVVRRTFESDDAVRLAKGDELGIFHLGSTVVLFAGPQAREIDGLAAGPVTFGEPLLRAGEGPE